MNLAEKRVAAKRILAQRVIDSNAPVVQEQHPDIGFLDRLAIKNTDMDTAQASKFLQGKYPNLQVQDRDGNLIVKNKGEREWKVVDPSGFDLQDVTDLGGTFLEGATQTIGGMGGAALGIPGGPVGILAGTAAGSGLASGAADLIKQKIRQALGVQEDIDLADVGVSAGIGAAMGPLFGGASKSAVKNIASPFVKSVAEKGLVGTGYNAATRKAAPAIASFLSGGDITAKEFRRAISRPKILEEIAKDSTKPSEAVANYLLTRAKTAKSMLKPEYDNLANSDAIVDITGAASKFRNLVLSAKKAMDENPGIKAFENEYKKAIKLYDEVALTGTGNNRQEIGKTTASTAYKLKDIFRDLADKNAPTNLSTGNKNGAVYAAAVDAKAKINSVLDDISGGIRQEYKKLSDHERSIKKLFTANTQIGETTKKSNVLKKLGKKGNEEFTKKFNELSGPLKFKTASGEQVLKGVNAEDIALTQRAFRNLYSPSYSPNYLNRTFGNLGSKLLLGGAGGLIGSQWGTAGMAAGAGLGMLGTSPGMLKFYLKSGKKLESVPKKLYNSGGKMGIRGLITNQFGE